MKYKSGKLASLPYTPSTPIYVVERDQHGIPQQPQRYNTYLRIWYGLILSAHEAAVAYAEIMLPAVLKQKRHSTWHPRSETEAIDDARAWWHEQMNEVFDDERVHRHERAARRVYQAELAAFEHNTLLRVAGEPEQIDDCMLALTSQLGFTDTERYWHAYLQVARGCIMITPAGQARLRRIEAALAEHGTYLRAAQAGALDTPASAPAPKPEPDEAEPLPF